MKSQRVLPLATTEFLKAVGDVTEFLFSFGIWMGGDWTVLTRGAEGGNGDRQASKSFNSVLSGLLLTTSRKYATFESGENKILR